MTAMVPSTPHPNSDKPTLPRRTAKACASCRHDKIRCDGARPCAGCVKKGFPADQCIDGCEHCRRARVRCEGGKPCQRCREGSLECVEDTANQPVRPDARLGPATAVPRPPRPYSSDRAKLACQSCRRDNKKCDDQRPCARCVVRSEECIHVGRGLKLVQLRCEACRRDNKRCEDSRPCKHCVENGQECVSVARKGGGHGTRVKAACTNCRRDKIRCDGVRPCNACSRKGFECVDRACRLCTQTGRVSECTHRKQAGDGGEEETTETSNAQPSTSAHQLAPTPQASHGTTPYTLGTVPPFYSGSLHPPPGPSHVPPMFHVMFPTEQTAYDSVIDPDIECSAPRVSEGSQPTNILESPGRDAAESSRVAEPV